MELFANRGSSADRASWKPDRAVIGKCLKQSGMFWSQSGAENVLALRCALMRNRWDECWNQTNHSNEFHLQAAA